MSYILELSSIEDKARLSQATFSKSVSTFNVTFSDMDDDFKSIIIDKKVCIWIGAKGEIGEVEAISSAFVDNQKLLLKHRIEKNGAPLFNVIRDLEENIIDLQLKKNNSMFSIFWGDVSKDCIALRSNRCTFYVQQNLLVGIEAEDYVSE